MKTKILALLLAAASFNLFAQTADEIVKKHIDAIGGVENWNKLKSLKMNCVMKAQGADITINIQQVDKKAMRQDVSVMGMSGYSIMTKTEGWNYMPFQGQTKPEPMTADDVKNAQDDLNLQDDFLTYKELGKKLEFIGKDDVDGTECLKLKMIDKDAVETTYYIDPANYYVIKQTQKFKADGKEVEGSTLFGNYQKTPEGIVFPMSMTNEGGETEVVKLEINPTIDDSVFKPAK